MDHRKRLEEIAEFLQPYQRIWQNEIMLGYPTPLANYPTEWVAELAAITDRDQLIRLEKKEVDGLIHSPELKDFYQRIEQLTEVSSASSPTSLPQGKFTFLYIIPKKKHEIQALAPFVKDIFDEVKAEEIIDIGGGVGLLAQTLSNQFQLPVTSLDMEPVLQATGRERHLKNKRIPLNKVNYQTIKVGPHPEFKQLLNSEVLTIGLHACGPLSNDQLRESAACGVKAMINFGCCYHKLHDQTDQNVSRFAQNLQHKLTMHNYALTLASRAHRKMDSADFEFKNKVKYFRYAFHFLLHDHYGCTGMTGLGNSPASLYHAPFSRYARHHLNKLGMEMILSEKELNTFYESPAVQGLIWKMQAATLIRNALGRVLEMYLLLDRVIMLEEHGYRTSLSSFFDEGLSPRNLGIIARRRKYYIVRS